MQGAGPTKVEAACAVVGGVNRELCRFPHSDSTWGSGGRAAAVIAGLGFQATLYTATDSKTTSLISSLAHTFGFQLETQSLPITHRFEYDHGLSTPLIWPPVSIDRLMDFEVHADNALVFGMLEANPQVFAKRLVYDPQNPLNPSPFTIPKGSHSPSIAYVLNSVEARKLAHSDDVLEAARKISDSHRLEVVVVKRGPWGALVYENGRLEHIPAYATDTVWPIGSGDVFAAVFAARWASQGLTFVNC